MMFGHLPNKKNRLQSNMNLIIVGYINLSDFLKNDILKIFTDSGTT